MNFLKLGTVLQMLLNSEYLIQIYYLLFVYITVMFSDKNSRKWNTLELRLLDLILVYVHFFISPKLLDCFISSS